jgi:hypothetical protein
MAQSKKDWRIVARLVAVAAMAPSAARSAVHHAGGELKIVVRMAEGATGDAVMRSYSSAR